MTPFGKTASGQEVQALTLASGELTVTLLTLGAALQSVRLAGVGHDLTLGSDKVADYEGPMRHHGTLIAPVVNRITGGVADLDGATLRFERNQDDRITLHSGAAGTHLKVWQVEEAGPDHATLALTLPDGEGGFPGQREVRARFALSRSATLTLTIEAETDAPTLFNAANHSYWNLDGGADWSGHRLRIDADRYLPATADFTPTGEIAPLAGSPVDLRGETAIAPGLPALDTNFCLADRRGELRDVLWLKGLSGVSMTLATTEPGVQVYDGRNAIRPGRAAYEGLAIEAQFWPDAPAHRHFPSIVLRPGESYRQITRWTFSR